MKVIFQFVPRVPLGQLDPAIVTKELSTIWQEEILERELITGLAPVHVANSWQLSGEFAALWEHLTVKICSDPCRTVGLTSFRKS